VCVCVCVCVIYLHYCRIINDLRKRGALHATNLHTIHSRRCPIIKFALIAQTNVCLFILIHFKLYLQTSYSIDISINNHLAVNNTRWMRELISQDRRIYELIIIARQWAKYEKLTSDAGEQHLLSNYTLALLAIYVCQVC
jgi:DNA polymerase sigma